MQKNKIFIYRFNESLKNPCYLLNFQEVNILLDCPVDLTVLRNFLPLDPLLLDGASDLPKIQKEYMDFSELCTVTGQKFFDTEFKLGFLKKSKVNEINIDTIDVILISNSVTMLGLPFITENCQFKGKIFATEPTMQFARIMMMDMVGNIKALPKLSKTLNINSVELLKLNEQYQFTSDLSAWYDIYSERAVQSCLSRIQKIAYNEPLNLFGLLQVCGVCSGYSIGSCNWLISSKYEKISYISHSSGIVSHVSPLETSCFKDVDIMIVGTAVQQISTPIEKVCDELCGKICDTVKSGGNVLIPISCCGLFFDIIEKLCYELDQRRLERTQMFIISSQSKMSLAYANVYGEWLNRSKETQLYVADYPFAFERLIKSNVLIPCEDISGEFSEKYRSPAIVFASHPSLRMGPVVHLLRLWSSNPLNSLLLVDTENYSFPPLKKEQQIASIDRLLAPYRPIAMSVHYYPLETGIKINEIPALIEQMSLPTRCLVLPTECASNKTVIKIAESIKRFELKSDKCVQIVLPHDRAAEEDVAVSQSLADRLRPIVVDDDTSVALFNGKIVHKDGQYGIVEATQQSNHHLPKPRCLFGTLDPNQFVDELKMRGLTNAKLDALDDGKTYIVYFNEEDCLIHLYDNSTHVFCVKEEMRKKIQEALLSCFSVLSIS